MAGELKYPCPWNEDEDPSLRVHVGKQTWYCDPCRIGGDVFRFVERFHKCDFSSALAFLAERAGITGNSHTSPVAATVRYFPYTDEAGRPLSRSVRRGPGFGGERKSIWQERITSTGKWVKGTKGVRRVPYRLPDLQGRMTVFVPEGEPHCDRLCELGLPATCNSGGGKKWTEQETAALAQAGVKELVLLPDHDDVGRQHVEQVAAISHRAGLRVKVVPLPDLPEKGDILNWLDAGHSKAELVALVEATPLWTPVTPVRPTSPLTRQPIVTYLHTVEPEDIDWLWPGRFARGKYTLVAGEPGVGKTYLLTDAAARTTRIGHRPDGAAASLGKVLYLTAEDGIADTIRPRLDALGGDPSKVAMLEAVRLPDGSRRVLSLVQDLDMLAAAIREVEPALVIIDPITAYLGSVDTHRDADVRSALAPLIDLIGERRCALAAIGHRRRMLSALRSIGRVEASRSSPWRASCSPARPTRVTQTAAWSHPSRATSVKPPRCSRIGSGIEGSPGNRSR